MIRRFSAWLHPHGECRLFEHGHLWIRRRRRERRFVYARPRTLHPRDAGQPTRRGADCGLVEVEKESSVARSHQRDHRNPIGDCRWGFFMRSAIFVFVASEYLSPTGRGTFTSPAEYNRAFSIAAGPNLAAWLCHQLVRISNWPTKGPYFGTRGGVTRSPSIGWRMAGN